MKIFATFITCLLIHLPTFSQTKNGVIPLGNVICRTKDQYLDSTKQAYRIFYLDNLINTSSHLIDISLTQKGFPFFREITAHFYWDTAFKLNYVTSTQMGDERGSSKIDTIYPPSGISLDSLFAKLTEEGVFSLPLVSTEDLRKSWKANYISKKGELRENSTGVDDGDEYVLTFKVNACYGQYIFDNPDIYSKAYIDNFVFKRQAAIVKIIMSGYK